MKRTKIIFSIFAVFIILLGGLVLGSCSDGKHALAQELIQALKDDDLIKMEELLKKGADPNIATSIFQKNIFAQTLAKFPFYEACSANNLKAVELMLEYGANPNLAPKHYNLTALGSVCYYGEMNENKFEIVKILVENGANINQVNNSGSTPLAAILKYPAFDQTNEIFFYLIERGANIKIEEMDLILFSSGNYNNAALDYLLAKGTDINAKNNLGKTALIYLVLRYSPNRDESKKHLEMISYVLERGANKNMKDNDGKTALDYASETGNSELIELFTV